MSRPQNYSFQRYLLAKQRLDDRSLNHQVLEHLREFARQAGSLRVLELGAGVGTMLERLVTWGIMDSGDYLGIDSDPVNIAEAIRRVPGWAAQVGIDVYRQVEGYLLRTAHSGNSLRIDYNTADALKFCSRLEIAGTYDLLVAHAFLDLFDLPTVLPVFLQVLRPGGVFYFTLNFDGDTIFEPQVDASLDEQVITLYHRTMDERRVNGLPSGDSRSGRHLFSLLPVIGGVIQAAGASDWVVYPRENGYEADEAYFLHHILHFFEQSLCDHPEIDADRISAWLELRHAQVERNELVYIAHQIDFMGTRV